MVPGGLPKPLPKNIPQKYNRYRKNTENVWFGGAQKTRKQRRMDELFVTFSAPGVPGTPLGHPGHRNSPKTSPKSLRDPPGRQFFMIFGQFLTPVFGSCCCFVGLFSLSLCHVRKSWLTGRNKAWYSLFAGKTSLSLNIALSFVLFSLSGIARMLWVQTDTGVLRSSLPNALCWKTPLAASCLIWVHHRISLGLDWWGHNAADES